MTTVRLLHRYAGLALALLLAVIGLTGSLLVFYPAQDYWLTPALHSESGPHLPLDRILAAAAEAVPDAAPTRLQWSLAPGYPHVVRFPGPAGGSGPLQVAVDPVTAQVRAVRQWGAYPMSWVYRLHYTLLGGRVGMWIVGTCGLLLLFFCISGLWLWWPVRGRWRSAFRIVRDQGRFRFQHGLHRVSGVIMAPVLVVVAFSGVAMVFREPVTALVGAVLPMERAQPRPESLSVAHPVSLEQALQVAWTQFPQARPSRIDLAAWPQRGARFVFRYPGEGHGLHWVWVNGAGQVVQVRDGRAAPMGQRFMDWQFPLHNGAQLGLPGRLLVLCSGLVLVLLCWSGLVQWWCRPSRRRRHHHR